MVESLVSYELFSESPFLRLTTCKVYAKLSKLPFRNEEHLKRLADYFRRNLCDGNLAIRYNAALTMQKFIQDQPIVREFLAKHLPYVLDDFFALHRDT
jgi:hypothetical protein